MSADERVRNLSNVPRERLQQFTRHYQAALLDDCVPWTVGTKQGVRFSRYNHAHVASRHLFPCLKQRARTLSFNPLQKTTALRIGLAIIASLFLSHGTVLGGDGRTSISLNGTWQIEESVSATEMPKAFAHTVVVPGMANLSRPSFPDVDLFASREYLKRFGRKYPWGGPEILPASAPLPVVGISPQQRNYFWYRTSFTLRSRKEVALLKIGKCSLGRPFGSMAPRWANILVAGRPGILT